jgi:hypothetical protein
VNRFTLAIDGDRIQPIVAEFAQAGPGEPGPDRLRVALGELTLDLDEAAAEDLADAIVDAISIREAALVWPGRRR